MDQPESFYDHYFDDRLYLSEYMILVQDKSYIIRVPYIHASTYGNGDYKLQLFSENLKQFNLLTKYQVHALVCNEFRLKEDFKKINYNVAKYLIEKLYRFYFKMEHEYFDGKKDAEYFFENYF